MRGIRRVGVRMASWAPHATAHSARVIWLVRHLASEGRTDREGGFRKAFGFVLRNHDLAVHRQVIPAAALGPCYRPCSPLLFSRPRGSGFAASREGERFRGAIKGPPFKPAVWRRRAV